MKLKKKILENKAGFQAKNSQQLKIILERLINNKRLNIKTFKNFEKLCDFEMRQSQLSLNDLLK